MQPAPPASPASASDPARARPRRSPSMRSVPALVRVALALGALAASGATPAPAPAAQSEVRVRFSSPGLSYEHGSRSGLPAALPAPPPPPPPPPLAPAAAPAPAPLQTHVRRGRLVQFVLAPDESQLPTAVAALTLQAASAPSVEEDEALLALPVTAEVLARALASPIFFGTFPHAEALLRYERGRQASGLAADLLGSARPESPFYRWPSARSRRRSSSSSRGGAGRRRGARARNPLWYY